MRIVFVISCRGLIPGGQVRVLNFLDLLRERGVESEVISLMHPVQLAAAEAHNRMRRCPSAGRRIAWWLRQAANLAVYPVHRRLVEASIRRAVRRCDAIFVQWIPLHPHLVAAIADSGCRLVYDVDDAVFLKDPAGFRLMAEAAWKVVAGSRFTADYARRFTAEVCHIPSAVDLRPFAGAAKPVRRIPTIGWIGGPSNVPYLHQVAESLRALHDSGRRFRLLFAGTAHSPDLPDFGDIEVVDIASYVAADLAALVDSLDIGLVPLPDDDWARGKTALKYLVYAAGSVPAVASPVGEIRRIAAHGESVLFATTPDEWRRGVENLLDSPELRRDIGHAASVIARTGFSREVIFGRLDAEVLTPLERCLSVPGKDGAD